jgi:hypothetical protein
MAQILYLEVLLLLAAVEAVLIQQLLLKLEVQAAVRVDITRGHFQMARRALQVKAILEAIA